MKWLICIFMNQLILADLSQIIFIVWNVFIHLLSRVM